MLGDFQMQQRKIRDVERKRRSEALSAQRMASFRGMDRQQSVLLNMRKAKVADRAAMRDNAADMASFRGLSSRDLGVGRGLSPVRKGRKTIDLELGTLMEEKAEKRISDLRISGLIPQRGLLRQRSSFGDFEEIKEDKENRQKEKKKKKVKSKKKDKDTDKDKSQKRESKSKKDVDPPPPSPATQKKEGKERKTVELEFSFGIITDLDVIPDMTMLETASIFAVRDILQGADKECGIRCDPDMPQVEPDVEEDVWYDSEFEIRWKLKGKVSVKIYVLKSLDAMEAAAPIQKMLKRYSSYREVSEAGGKVKSWEKVKEDLFGGITF